MSGADARRILDAARAGEPVSETAIVRALIATGDITRPTMAELATAERTEL